MPLDPGQLHFLLSQAQMNQIAIDNTNFASNINDFRSFLAFYEEKIIRKRHFTNNFENQAMFLKTVSELKNCLTDAASPFDSLLNYVNSSDLSIAEICSNFREFSQTQRQMRPEIY